MENIIKKLYYGKFAPYADPPPRSERARAASEKYEQAYDAFTAKLKPDMRRECNRMLEAHTEESCYDTAESFVQGYRLGARMMLDILAQE